MKIKISKSQWEQAGKTAGWMPRDPTDISDKDLNPIYSPQDEEDALLGKDESQENVNKSVYKEGYQAGASKENDSSTCPYRSDTKLSNIWWEGFKKGKESKNIISKTVKTVKTIKTAQNLEIVKTPEKFTDRELTRSIRDAIIAEEGAIKQYETVVDATDNEKVKRVLQSIADEERVHVGELQTLLNSLLDDEVDLLEKGKQEVEDNK